MADLHEGNAAEQHDPLHALNQEADTQAEQIRDSDLPQAPNFRDLRSEPELVKELEEADLEDAQREAQRAEFENILEISEWAQSEMEEAPMSVREAAKAMSRVDLQHVASKSTELVSKFEELGMGDMNKSWFQRLVGRVFGRKGEETLSEFKDRAKPVMRDKDQILEAIDDEKTKLKEVFRLLETQKGKNRDLYHTYTKKGAVAEIARDNALESAVELADRYEGTRDILKIEELQDSQERIIALDARIAEIKNFRTETFVSSQRFKQHQQAVERINAMLNANAAMMDLVFENAVMEEISSKAIGRSADAIEAGRTFIKDLQEGRMQRADEMLERVKELRKEGAMTKEVARAVLEHCANTTVRAGEMAEEIRGHLKDFSDMQDRMDADLKTKAYEASIKLEPKLPGTPPAAGPSNDDVDLKSANFGSDDW